MIFLLLLIEFLLVLRASDVSLRSPRCRNHMESPLLRDTTQSHTGNPQGSFFMSRQDTILRKLYDNFIEGHL